MPEPVAILPPESWAPESRRPTSRRTLLRLGLFAMLSLAYFAVAVRVSADRPLWFDEILTWHLAQLPDDSTIWSALIDGPDASPPLNLLLVRRLTTILGAGPLAVRLTSMVGVWVLGACLLIFASRGRSAASAWIAPAVLLTTRAAEFVVEGRPYGLWMGCCGLMLVCWQAAGRSSGPARAAALLGLALSGSASMSSHLFAPLTFIPLGLGELARSWRLRRVDVPLWLALFAGVIPLPFYLPIVKGARVYTATFFGRFGFTTPMDFYRWLLGPATFALVATLVLLTVAARIAPPRPAEDRGMSAPPLHEVVAAVGYLAIPGYLMVIGLVTGDRIFVERYCVAAAIGFALLVAYLVPTGWSRPWVGSAFVSVLVVCAAANAFHEHRIGIPARKKMADLIATLDRLGDGQVAATGDPIAYLALNFHAPPALRSRLVFLVDWEGPEGTASLCVRKLQPWASARNPLRIERASDFLGSHGRFLLFGPDHRSWQVASRGFRIDPLPDRDIWQAQREGESPAPSTPRDPPRESIDGRR